MRIFAVGTKIFGGWGWPTFGGGAVPPGPNVEPPRAVACTLNSYDYPRKNLQDCTTKALRFEKCSWIVPSILWVNRFISDHSRLLTTIHRVDPRRCRQSSRMCRRLVAIQQHFLIVGYRDENRNSVTYGLNYCCIGFHIHPLHEWV